MVACLSYELEEERLLLANSESSERSRLLNVLTILRLANVRQVSDHIRLHLLIWIEIDISLLLLLGNVTCVRVSLCSLELLDLFQQFLCFFNLSCIHRIVLILHANVISVEDCVELCHVVLCKQLLLRRNELTVAELLIDALQLLCHFGVFLAEPLLHFLLFTFHPFDLIQLPSLGLFLPLDIFHALFKCNLQLLLLRSHISDFVFKLFPLGTHLFGLDLLLA